MALRMRRSLALAVTAVTVCTAPLGGAVTARAGAGATASGGTWGTAIEVPGIAALNLGGHAALESVSCPSAGNCAAGGFYTDLANHEQAFVVTEIAGRWGRALEVPGTAALDAGARAGVTSVSCPSAGSCGAGGGYEDRSHHTQVFVVNERSGRWGRALELPGLAALNVGGFARIGSVSCPSPGNCAAAGDYRDARGRSQAFAVSEIRGRWGRALHLSGAGLVASDFTALDSVSCPSAGNCIAGGADRPHGSIQAIAVSQTHGRWGKAVKIPVPAALGAVSISIGTLSCPSPGSCGAGGVYQDAAGKFQAFVVSERKGRWGQAREVPGTAALNTRGQAAVSSVSCPSPGNCGAGGFYQGRSSIQAFVVSKVNGIWGQAQQVPGLAGLSTGHQAAIRSVSCRSPGNCAAGGLYTGRSVRVHAFVVSQADGTWGKALQVPGTAALNVRGDAQVNSVSCPPPGNCAAVGRYTDRSDHGQPFVVTQGS
jgi:hypothetical protein